MSVIGQQLISIARAKAAANPDFIYWEPEGKGCCVYVHRGCPSCLNGHALWDAGLIDASFEVRREQFPGYTIPMPANEEGFGTVADLLGLELDAWERAWLENVQAQQDNELPWGAAVQAADDLLAEQEYYE